MKKLTALLLTLMFAFGGVYQANAQLSYSADELRSALQQGMDPDSTKPDGTTMLMEAIYYQEAEKASILIDAGADVDASNRYGVTPLFLAAQQRMDEIALQLLDAGADRTSTTLEGEPLLLTAAKAGSARIVAALLEEDPANFVLGADPNISEPWKGQTALMLAAAEGHVEVMEVLLENGADPNIRSAYIDVPEVDQDKRQGGFVYPDIPEGRMAALHFAAREGHLEAVRTLIEGGADLDIVDEKGSNALVLSTLNGHFDVAAELLEAGADPNVQDEYGRSVLFVATDMHTLDVNPRPAPKITSERDAVDIVRLALEHGADPDIQLTDRLPSWMAQGSGHNPVLREGATPFFRAAMSGDLEVMGMLLDAGADPTLGTAESERGGMYGRASMGQTTPLMVAAGLSWRESISRGRDSDAVETISMLMEEYDMDINATNQDGNTALHGAVDRGSEVIISYLIENGADLTALNSRDLSPLDIAEGQPEYRIDPKPEIAALLRESMTAEDFEAIEAEKARREAEAEAEAEEESEEES